MPWRKHDYDDIPGTYVFNGEHAASAYGLNKLLFSFNHAENRQAFAEDPVAYAAQYSLTEEQRAALLAGDFLKILQLGANIYYMAKLAIPSGVSVQAAGAAFQGITKEEFEQNLLAKGEGIEQRLEKEGGFWNG